MAKKLVAVTEIRYDDQVVPAGETLDASKFDKKQLEELYNAGAVRIDDGSSDESSSELPEDQKQLHAENQYVSADQSAEASSPVGEPKSPAAKSTAAPAKEATTNVKGNTK